MVSSSQRHGRSWPAILVLASHRHGLILPASWQVVAGHPLPPSIAALSSQRYCRSWPAILVIPASWRRPHSVTAGCGQPTSTTTNEKMPPLPQFEDKKRMKHNGVVGEI